LVYKYIFSLLIIFLLSCSEIERDNILDPKNPSSHSDKVLLLEAFVNTNNPLDYNTYALNAIDALTLDDDIKNHLIVLEYHRDTQLYSDPLEADSFNTENIYNSYMSYDPERFKGVPDLFLNGAEARVQGASSAGNVSNRVKDFATEQLLENGEYTIEVDFTFSTGNIDGKYRVARLGDKASEPTLLRMMITYNSGVNGKSTVSRVSSPISVAAIDAGDFIEDDFQINNIPAAKAEKLVLVLTDIDGINVLHALERNIL